VLRGQAGLTQQQLAEAIDRSLETVSSIERGVSSTRIETAARIAEVLGVGLQDMFDDGAATRQPVARQQLLNSLAEGLSGLDHAKATEVVEIAARIVKLARSG